MHELSLAEGVLELIDAAASRDGFNRVSAVWLEIGELAAVEVEALRFCFDAVVAGSLAAGARLEIISVPGSGVCLVCGKSVALAERFDICPDCSGEIRVTGGTEMRVRELEVA